MDELLSQTHDHLGGKEIISKNFTKQIAFNVIPHIDSFVDGGYTNEEWKMEHETQKILDKNVDFFTFSSGQTNHFRIILEFFI